MRSSTCGLPGLPRGRCGLSAFQASSDNQNKFFAMTIAPSNSNQAQIPIQEPRRSAQTPAADYKTIRPSSQQRCWRTRSSISPTEATSCSILPGLWFRLSSPQKTPAASAASVELDPLRDVAGLPLLERKALLGPIVADIPGLQFNGHETGDGELIRRHACQLGYEGVVSKTADAPYAPGNRGLWRKAKCLNRQEFVVVGWTDPEGSRPHLGALLLGYYTDDGKLIYAGRVGTGMSEKVLKDLRRRLDPLARPKSPLSAPPPRGTRFGSPLVLSRVHWVDPKLVAEITYLTWTADNLLRQTVYVGLREDKPAEQVRRER